ncbi:MAG: hypothetical protein N2260_05000 [Syntrophobacterales bacterium]|nr:hypothetical protein [Syntrophobacterales bacterium]
MGKHMDYCQFLPHNCHSPSTKKNLLLCSAIPEEYSPFLKRFGFWEKKTIKALPFFKLELPDRVLFLTPTGMGVRALVSHWQELIKYVKPNVIISFGFCGELSSSPPGKLFLSSQFVPLLENNSFRAVEQPLTLEILEFSSMYGITLAMSISTPVFISKHHVLKLITPSPPSQKKKTIDTSSVIIDMESVILANLAVRDKIPILSLRASTDAYDEDIPFDVETLLDEGGFVSIRKALYMLKEDPWLISSFMHFWKVSSRAARNLANVLERLINLPFRLETPRIMTSK